MSDPFVNSPLMTCPWCGQETRLEPIHGHMSCTSCKRPVEDCCNGEMACETEEKDMN